PAAEIASLPLALRVACRRAGPDARSHRATSTPQEARHGQAHRQRDRRSRARSGPRAVARDPLDAGRPRRRRPRAAQRAARTHDAGRLRPARDQRAGHPGEREATRPGRASGRDVAGRPGTPRLLTVAVHPPRPPAPELLALLLREDLVETVGRVERLLEPL